MFSPYYSLQFPHKSCKRTYKGDFGKLCPHLEIMRYLKGIRGKCCGALKVNRFIVA